MPISSVGNRSSARAKNAGVTLVEMIVVVAIVGLIAAVSAPSVAGGLDSIRLSTASGDIATFLNFAVTRSVRRQEPVELIISVKDNKLIAIGQGFSRELPMPKGITMEAVLPVDDTEGPDAERHIMILPGATAPAIGVQFSNRHGARRIVHLDPMTGFPRVESVNKN